MKQIIEKWRQESKDITVMSFMIYGYIGKRDILTIQHAIKLPMNIEFIVVAEDVSRTEADTWGVYEGILIQFYFPSKLTKEQIQMIKEIILDGLEYLKIKAEHHNTTEI
jgi:hypothetical protein